jgi:dTDP-glucose 4,6-dehydratase
MSPTARIRPAKLPATILFSASSPYIRLPVPTTNCSNNYGPFHFPEKLIPLTIVVAGRLALPVYGDGQQYGTGSYVIDHCSAIRCVLASGKLGQVYNVVNEKANIAIVHTVCDLLDELGHALMASPMAQISYVRDSISRPRSTVCH